MPCFDASLLLPDPGSRSTSFLSPSGALRCHVIMQVSFLEAFGLTDVGGAGSAPLDCIKLLSLSLWVIVHKANKGSIVLGWIRIWMMGLDPTGLDWTGMGSVGWIGIG